MSIWQGNQIQDGDDRQISAESDHRLHLFHGFQPTIVEVDSTTITFGANFVVTVGGVGTQATQTFKRMVLLRPGAVTHNYDADQRYIELQSVPNTAHAQMTSFTVTAPTADLGPPGYYMLFAITSDLGNEAPSVAQFIRLVE